MKPADFSYARMVWDSQTSSFVSQSIFLLHIPTAISNLPRLTNHALYLLRHVLHTVLARVAYSFGCTLLSSHLPLFGTPSTYTPSRALVSPAHPILSQRSSLLFSRNYSTFHLHCTLFAYKYMRGTLFPPVLHYLLAHFTRVALRLGASHVLPIQ